VWLVRKKAEIGNPFTPLFDMRLVKIFYWIRMEGLGENVYWYQLWSSTS
jgi:hypothetical protein